MKPESGDHEYCQKERQQQDMAQIEQEMRDAQHTLDTDRNGIEEIERRLAEDNPQLEQIRNSEAEISILSRKAEEAMQVWQQDWDALNRKLAEAEQQEQVERSRIEQLNRNAEQLRHRLERIELEQRVCGR